MSSTAWDILCLLIILSSTKCNVFVWVPRSVEHPANISPTGFYRGRKVLKTKADA